MAINKVNKKNSPHFGEWRVRKQLMIDGRIVSLPVKYAKTKFLMLEKGLILTVLTKPYRMPFLTGLNRKNGLIVGRTRPNEVGIQPRRWFDIIVMS